jgi:D-sedoheptulose 7-phosphate isomerase
MGQDFESTLSDHIASVGAIDAAAVRRMAEIVVAALRGGGKVLVCGNGGSAADAQHFAAELVVRFESMGRRALPALALAADACVLTAAGNDLGYECVFSRLVEAFGRPGDVLLCLSTSGRSENVLRALRTAKSLGILTAAITGDGESPVLRESDHGVAIRGRTARVQEGTILVLHHLASAIDAAF